VSDHPPLRHIKDLENARAFSAKVGAVKLSIFGRGNQSMEARSENPVIFRKMVDALREFFGEAKDKCKDTGEFACIWLVLLSWESHTRCQSIGSIQNIMKSRESNDTLTLRTNAENSELTFPFENAGRYFRWR
jgi:hypothetical protein